MHRLKYIIFIFAIALTAFHTGGASDKPNWNAVEIQLALNKLKVLGSALYIAAHPDDENTALLAYLSKEKLIQTAYLSLTRGDGGQNLIGTEAGELLGVLRTQELLAARRIDGAEQYFTRAIDFGYSKTPEESIDIWDKEKILHDIVWIIRKLQPDIIITRFTPDRGGHGHHRASAKLALDAFEIAGDTNKFPEQLKYTEVWQPKRIFWNSWKPAVDRGQIDTSKMPYSDLGEYNPLLGKSYGEISADSRSMHKSQGFGAAPWRGSYKEYFMLMAGDSATTEILQGIDLSWSRVPGGNNIPALIEQSIQSFRPENPATIVPNLLEIYSELKNLPSSYWVEIKKQEVKKLIFSCLGVWMEATAKDYWVTAGSPLQITFNAINRSQYPIALDRVSLSISQNDTLLQRKLNYNEPLIFLRETTIPRNTEISQPYWLKNRQFPASYNVTKLNQIGVAANPPAISAIFTFQIQGIALEYDVPVLYKWTDPVAGERLRQVIVVPKIDARFTEEVYFFPTSAPQKVHLRINSLIDNNSAILSLKMPQSWLCNPQKVELKNMKKNEEKIVEFSVRPPVHSETINAVVTHSENNKATVHAMEIVDYSHIPIQTVFPPTSAIFARVELQEKPKKIGYISGSGDKLPDMLSQLGFTIDILDQNKLSELDLNDFDTIITGIRAYNTNAWLQNHHHRLLNFVYAGGNLIIQYNVSRKLEIDSLGPYPFKISRDRVSQEEAPVNFLLPEHPILNFPYKITSEDFQNWTQERGLYFANEWSNKYETPIASYDTGEEPKAGGILFAHYGQGTFIYTGYSFFRQIPAGVPGALKLFLNMIAAGDTNGN
jgi:LmbE family N-acetylglucosaminyl deacetylase